MNRRRDEQPARFCQKHLGHLVFISGHGPYFAWSIPRLHVAGAAPTFGEAWDCAVAFLKERAKRAQERAAKPKNEPKKAPPTPEEISAGLARRLAKHRADVLEYQRQMDAAAGLKSSSEPTQVTPPPNKFGAPTTSAAFWTGDELRPEVQSILGQRAWIRPYCGRFAWAIPALGAKGVVKKLRAARHVVIDKLLLAMKKQERNAAQRELARFLASLRPQQAVPTPPPSPAQTPAKPRAQKRPKLDIPSFVRSPDEKWPKERTYSADEAASFRPGSNVGVDWWRESGE